MRRSSPSVVRHVHTASLEDPSCYPEDGSELFILNVEKLSQKKMFFNQIIYFHVVTFPFCALY
jgi:hypothetical protein